MFLLRYEFVVLLPLQRFPFLTLQRHDSTGSQADYRSQIGRRLLCFLLPSAFLRVVRLGFRYLAKSSNTPQANGFCIP